MVVAAKPLPRRKGKGKGKWKGKGKGYAPAVVVQQPVLAIAGVSVPAGADENRGDVHYFAVDVLPEGGGGPWRVMRRYNDFNAFHDKIGKPSFPDAPFPGKHLFGIGLKIDDRRRGLEAWLQRIIQNPSSRGPWAIALNNFLTAGRQALATPGVPIATASAAAPGPYAAAPAPSAPAVSSDPVAAPLPPPSAPPASDPSDANPISEEAAQEADKEDGGSVLAIEIPAGVPPGAVLGITVPDGKQVNFTVPGGKAGGDTVELWYDASAGTLTPME